MNELKLIIWDLDSTFWNGDLESNNVKLNKTNLKIVKKLNKIGIINSISSKNDYELRIKK